VFLLESLEVASRHLVVGVLFALLRDVDDDGRANQLLYRDLVDRQMALREVDRRIDVGTAVLGGEEAV
jgi:hypothetical protein